MLTNVKVKALVGAFNQEKALVGAFSVIVQPVVEPMDRFTALAVTLTAPTTLMLAVVCLHLAPHGNTITITVAMFSCSPNFKLHVSSVCT